MLPMEGVENGFLRLKFEAMSTLLTETIDQAKKTKKAEQLFETDQLASDLKGQLARSAELEYSIVAINKAGEGDPSNTVMVVL